MMHPNGRDKLARAVGVTALAVGLVFAPMSCRRDDAPNAPDEPAGSLSVLGGKARPGLLEGFNLLFITIDTLRRDHIGCYGDEGAHTPTIDGLAHRGILFDHAVTASPSTLPSHCTMMTGLELPSHGVRTNGMFTLGEDITTLAEVLKSEGYATAAVTCTFVLNARFGLSQGFDLYDDWDQLASKNDPDGQRRADETTDLVTAWMDQHLADADSPFFVWAHYFDPHRSYDPPEPYATQFADRPYDGEIAYADEHIGRLLAFLDQRGLTDRTLVVLTADHGEGLFEHGEKDHSRLIYDTTMRIPLILSCPARLASNRRVSDVTVGTVDLMPTILSLLGVDSGLDMDGLDLVTQEVPKDRAIYIESLAGRLYSGWAGLHGLRRIDEKYIAAPLPEDYDLVHDQGELDNRFERDPSAGADLAQELKDLLRKWPDDDEAAAKVVAMNLPTTRHLNALGYLSGKADSKPGQVDRLDPKDGVPIFDLIHSTDTWPILKKIREWVLKPDQPKASYRKALILANVLCERKPDNQTFETARGMALYRVGRFEDALEHLLNARASCAKVRLPVDGENLVFLVMVLDKLGRKEDAQARLAELESIIANPGTTAGRATDAARAVAVEARALLREGQGAP